MNTTAQLRRIVVLLPAPLSTIRRDDLLADACALARHGTTALDVIELAPCAPAPGADACPTLMPCALPVASTWWRVQHPALAHAIGHRLAQASQQALTESGLLASGAPLLVLLPPDPLGGEVAALLAMALGASALGRCQAIDLEGQRVIARRTGWGGRVELAVHCDEAVCVATLRAADKPTGAPAGEHPPHPQSMVLPDEPMTEITVTPQAATDAMPPLEGASLVVSGGRGMQGEEGFGLLRSVAQVLGASLGGSLPTVDAGWVPVARQIGQSGKFVSPRLYLAVGISGTPQHLAGIATDTPIVAINHDPDAPIFRAAQVGVVGDWRELLPLLLSELQAAR